MSDENDQPAPDPRDSGKPATAGDEGPEINIVRGDSRGDDRDSGKTETRDEQSSD